MRLAIIALLLAIPLATALDFSPPQVLNITLRESDEGIFCHAHTNDVSWPIYQWKINGREIRAFEPLLTTGFSPGDDVECVVIATTGFENSTSSKHLTATNNAPPAITGAIIGGGNGDVPPIGTWLLVIVLGAMGAGLVVLNIRAYKKVRK